MHTDRLRELDRPDPQFLDPFDDNVDGRGASSCAGCVEGPDWDDGDILDEEMEEEDGMDGGEDTEGEGDGDRQERIETFEYSAGTVHGPAMPGDDPEQLYDNWAGELADWGGDMNAGVGHPSLDGGDIETGWIASEQSDTQDLAQDAWPPSPPHAAGEADTLESGLEQTDRSPSPAETISEYNRLSSPARPFDEDEDPGEEQRE
ncbi:hypothetical protein TRAPUB_12200 [Trametes pubescens]|uniref:Uncharacterized protein n=1 Tax=Trametes pubescens TaxID=154538 RepID=A0A1M2VUQ4_TRAPU|nr:hypothetical protein TRAPUB_12200 [Trametes pubescens]